VNRRLWRHPILEFKRGRKLRFYFEDKEIEGYEGECIAAALYANGIDAFSYSKRFSRPRGPFCMIGKCSSCFMIVDGVPNVRVCREPVREGVRVCRQKGLSDVPDVKEVFESAEETLEADLLVIGSGPAGLSAAIKAADYGLNVVLVDEHFRLGGQLVKQTHKFFGSEELFGGLRGFQIAEALSKKVREKSNIKVLAETIAFGIFRDLWVGLACKRENKVYRVKAKNILVSTGASENYLAFPGNDLIGVMGAGGVQTLMNEYGVKPGEEAVIIGSGNVGLILAYQLLQAGVKVHAIAEIAPTIGGWFVHAAKIRRYGVPILIRHSVKEARGKERVEEVILIEFDEKYNPIPGTEKVYRCDLLVLAVGLTPDTRLLAQLGVKMAWVPELGGYVPYRTKYMETSIPGVFVAGDAAGIEEASTAMIEGAIAALTAVLRVKGDIEKARKEREELLKFLNELRKADVSARVREGLRKIIVEEVK